MIEETREATKDVTDNVTQDVSLSVPENVVLGVPATPPNVVQDAPQSLISGDSQSVAPPYEWILHPTIDLLFVCGGLIWMIFLVHFCFLRGNSDSTLAQWMVILAALGTVFLSQAHVVATLVRLYNDPVMRERFTFYSYWLAIGCATLALAGCLYPALAGIYCRIYLLIVSQHFTAQAYGFSLLYCMKRGYRMSAFDKGAMSALMRSTMAYAILLQCTYKEWSGDKFLGQSLPFWGPLPEVFAQGAAVCIVISAIIFAGCLVRNFVVSRKVFPVPSLLLIVTGVTIFVLGPKATGILWIYVPAFFHGSQYVVATTAYHLKEKGLPEGLASNQIATLLTEESTYRYLGFLVLAGLALFMGLPTMLGQFGFNTSVATATIFTTVQFHHVLTDSAIWKMKEDRLRKILVS